MAASNISGQILPGEGLAVEKMPAYWLLARLGKRVLRPGGRVMTESLLHALGLGAGDRVVELAPGMGGTTRLITARRPVAYTGIERDTKAAAIVQDLLTGPEHECQVGTAQETGLDEASATVVVGEAFLTMQPDSAKRAMVAEAYRVLVPGGRYGMHELALRPDDLDEEAQARVRADLSAALHVGARPLTVAEWRALLEGAGFEITHEVTAPMALLRIGRIISDEGIGRTLLILTRVIRDRAVRARVRQMRANIQQHGGNLVAIALAARKPLTETAREYD